VGVGKVTQQALARLSVKTFKDLRQIPVEILEKKFGERGTAMHLLSMGIDERDVKPEREVKSIGHLSRPL